MQPLLLREARAFREICEVRRRAGGRVGVVPTMGALHEGHFALVAEAKRRTDWVAVSIFVNPTQFGPREDYASYPRRLAEDMEACSRHGVDVVFAPAVAEMYPKGDSTRVSVGMVADGLCGATRPGHFTGVATVVAKLLILAGASIAVFGRKDYQQLKVIERLVRDLLLPVEIVGHPTVREPDGLALSSRNAYLSDDERVQALAIPGALRGAEARFQTGERDAEALCRVARGDLESRGLVIDYVSVVDADSLAPLQQLGDRALLALAAFAGTTRLIDNLVLGEESPPLVPTVSA